MKSPRLPLNAAALRDLAISAACKEFGITPNQLETREHCHARWFAIVMLAAVPAHGYGFNWSQLGGLRAINVLRLKDSTSIRDWSNKLARVLPMARMHAVAAGRKLVAEWPAESERAA
jgi:hypothetical protein